MEIRNFGSISWEVLYFGGLYASILFDSWVILFSNQIQYSSTRFEFNFLRLRANYLHSRSSECLDCSFNVVILAKFYIIWLGCSSCLFLPHCHQKLAMAIWNSTSFFRLKIYSCGLKFLPHRDCGSDAFESFNIYTSSENRKDST